MQERYLGDSHDFLKYALLRHLSSALGWRIGVNWYLANPEEVDRHDNNDGQKRHHLRGGVWETSDPDLFAKIGTFDDPANRTLGSLEGAEILPSDTLYYGAKLSASNRDEWFEGSRDVLKPAPLIFLDPDNGFEVPSMSRGKAPKYAKFDEACTYFRDGHVVVSIQFARQCDPIQRGCAIRQALSDRCAGSFPLPIIRGRVAPNILFLTIARPEVAKPVEAALKSFAVRCAKAEIIE